MINIIPTMFDVTQKETKVVKDNKSKNVVNNKKGIKYWKERAILGEVIIKNLKLREENRKVFASRHFEDINLQEKKPKKKSNDCDCIRDTKKFLRTTLSSCKKKYNKLDKCSSKNIFIPMADGIIDIHKFLDENIYTKIDEKYKISEKLKKEIEIHEIEGTKEYIINVINHNDKSPEYFKEMESKKMDGYDSELSS